MAGSKGQKLLRKLLSGSKNIRFGDVELIYDGPIEDKSEAQSQMLDTWTTRKLDAVAIACNDPEQISTSLSRARDEGVSVITYDADANPEASKRQFHVKQVGDQELSEAMVDEMARQAGAAAEVAVISSSPKTTVYQ